MYEVVVFVVQKDAVVNETTRVNLFEFTDRDNMEQALEAVSALADKTERML